MGKIWYDDRNESQTKSVPAWWREPKKDAGKAVRAVVQMLIDQQPWHQKRNLHHARLYGNMASIGLEAHNYEQLEEPSEDRITFNVVESAIDTIHADITAQKSKSMFLTDDGDWTQQRRAEKLNTYVFGQFHHMKFWRKSRDKVVRDAMVFGTGCYKVASMHGRPYIERRFPNQMIVDDIDGRDGDPRCHYEQYLIDKDVLKQEFLDREDKKRAKLIEEARIDSMDNGKLLSAPQVEVTEAYHLPSSPSANDGRFVRCIHNAVLEDVETRDHPYVFMRYKPRTLGFSGKGVGEILSGGQVSINDLLWQIHEHLRLGGMKIFVKPGSTMNMAHLDNEILGVIECLEPPFLADFSSVPPDLFTTLREEIQNAYSLVGVSMMAASSELPAGLTRPSGKALRIYSDKKSQRFIKFAQEDEDCCVEVSEKLVELERKLQDDSKPYELLVPRDDGTAELLNWSKVSIDKDKYVIQSFPTSFLSATPASRVKDVQELVALKPDLEPYVLKLLDFPDLKSVTSLEGSVVDVTMMMIEHNLDGKDYMPPEPEMDLALTVKMAQAYYLKAKTRNAKPEDLEQLLQFMKQAREMKKQADDAMKAQMMEDMAAQQMPGPQGPMPGPGMPPPPDTGAMNV